MLKLLLLAATITPGNCNDAIVRSTAYVAEQVVELTRSVVIVDDIGRFIRQDGAPIRNGQMIFDRLKPIENKDGKLIIEASREWGLNGFSLGYTLRGIVPENRRHAIRLKV